MRAGHPVAALAAAAGRAEGAEGARMREAAQGFEALLWEEVLRAGLPGGGAWGGGAEGSVYGALAIEAAAEAVARAGGAGLWRLLMPGGA